MGGRSGRRARRAAKAEQARAGRTSGAATERRRGTRATGSVPRILGLDSPLAAGLLRLAPRAIGLILTAAPLVAVLVVLAPYLAPLDHAPGWPFSDVIHQHAPNVELLATGLHRDGELPRWNAQDFAGIPTVGDPQSGLYNPVYRLLLLWPGIAAFCPLIVAYTLAGAAGFLLYARALGLPLGAAAAGAVTFTLAGSLLLRLVVAGHTVFAPFFLVPILLWALHRAAERPRPARVAGAAALIALLAVSLHPQLAVYVACVVPAVAIAAAARARGALVVVALAGALGCALAAVHLLPILALAGEFWRGHPELFDAARADRVHALPSSWLADVVSGLGAAPGRELAWETHWYLGAPALAFAAIGLLAWPRRDPRRRLVWLHASLALALLVFALGAAGGIQPLLARLPGMAVFRIPARALVVLTLPVAVLVALGVAALTHAPPARRRAVAAAAGVAALVGLVATGAGPVHVVTLALAAAGGAALDRGAAARRRTTGARAASVHGNVRHGDGTDAPFAPGRVGEDTTLPAGGARGWVAVGALLVVVALAWDQGGIVAPYVTTMPASDAGRLAPGVALPGGVADGRVAELERGSSEPGIPELAVRRLGLETLAGSNPLIPWRFVLYASAAGGFDPFAYRFDVAVPLLERRAPVLFDLLGVTHFLRPASDREGDWRWERSATAFPRAYLAPGPIVVPEGAGATLVTREREALDRLEHLDPRQHVLLHGAAAEAALARVETATDELEPFRPVPLTTRAANRITLTATLERPGILVLNEPFFPGWRAWDGETELPVLRANVLFRAVVLAPGRHDLRLEFAPTSWRLGWWISVAVLAALASVAIIDSMRRRGAAR